MDKILNINDIIEPGVEYRGSVKILYMDRISGKARILKKHNAGGPGLFTAICRMLISLPTSNHIPSYIKGLDANNNNLFTQKIRYATTPSLYKTDEATQIDKLVNDAMNANVILYTFLIPVTGLKSSKNAITKLVLCNENDVECATLELDADEQIETNVGTNILIYWKLKFE